MAKTTKKKKVTKKKKTIKNKISYLDRDKIRKVRDSFRNR